MLFHDIETDRLMLKNISTGDNEFIFAQFSNDAVNRYLFDAEPLVDLQGADEILDFYTQPEPRAQHRWIIIRKEDGAKVGTCGFHCWDKASGECDIGYDLFPDFWGHGYMSEAMKAILAFARRDMKVKQINACIYPENENSIKLAEKHGFSFSGQTKNEVFHGEKYPHNIYVLEFSGE